MSQNFNMLKYAKTRIMLLSLGFNGFQYSCNGRTPSSWLFIAVRALAIAREAETVVKYGSLYSKVARRRV